MMFTSLSTMTGAPSAAPRVSRTGKWFQPGMIGGTTGAPSRWLTGPGTPTPTPCTSGAAPSARALPTSSSTWSSTVFGPSRTSAGAETRESRRSSPSVMATSIDVAPMSTPTKRSELASATTCERRPAAGRREAGGLDEAELGEPVELDGDLRLRQLHGLAELGAGLRASVAEQAQEASLVPVLRSHAHPPHVDPPPRVARLL
jgi:hypothetical protein